MEGKQMTPQLRILKLSQARINGKTSRHCKKVRPYEVRKNKTRRIWGAMRNYIRARLRKSGRLTASELCPPLTRTQAHQSLGEMFRRGEIKRIRKGGGWGVKAIYAKL